MSDQDTPDVEATPLRTIGTGSNTIEVHTDPDLPADVIELRGKDGVVFSRHKIATVARDRSTELYVHKMIDHAHAIPYAAPVGVAVAELRHRIEKASATFVAEAEGLGPVLDEVLADAVAVGSGFLRINWNTAHDPDNPSVGHWSLSRVAPMSVQLLEEPGFADQGPATS